MHTMSDVKPQTTCIRRDIDELPLSLAVEELARARDSVTRLGWWRRIIATAARVAFLALVVPAFMVCAPWTERWFMSGLAGSLIGLWRGCMLMDIDETRHRADNRVTGAAAAANRELARINTLFDL